jgi:hypothetical protein
VDLLLVALSLCRKIFRNTRVDVPGKEGKWKIKVITIELYEIRGIRAG